MLKLTKRQLNILGFLGNNGNAGNQEIKKYLEKDVDKIARITMVRDINFLLQKKLVKKKGKGRSVSYEATEKNVLLKYINVEEYFKIEPDKHQLLSELFNFKIFDILNKNKLFDTEELNGLQLLNKGYQKRIATLSSALLKKEFERLTIELRAWKEITFLSSPKFMLDLF